MTAQPTPVASRHPLSLSGRTAVVIGGTSGIGWARGETGNPAMGQAF